MTFSVKEKFAMIFISLVFTREIVKEKLRLGE